METLLGDLRLALRMLVKAPLFALLSIGALALGIGANAVMFGVIETVLLEPLVYRDSSRLVMVQTVLEESGTRIGSSPPDFYRLREKNRSFEGVAALYAQPLNLTGAQEPERVRALHVTANLLPLSGVEPAFGRGFSADDEKWGSQPVALISDGLWHTRFGGDRSVLGHTLALGGEPATIIGVLPKGFSWLGSEGQVLLPMSFAPGDNRNTHNNYFIAMVTRLRPGVSPDQARAELRDFGQGVQRDFPEDTLPEVDPLNFAPHVLQPTLMINGRYDFFFPVETSQQPLFALLGVKPSDKRHIVVDGGHYPPQDLLVKETVDWLDRYLGPVR